MTPWWCGMAERKIVVKVTRTRKYYVLRIPRDAVAAEPLAAKVAVQPDGRTIIVELIW